MINFDEITNIKFITVEKDNKINAFSFDNGIPLYVTFGKNTRIIESIRGNGTNIDVTKENLECKS